MGPTDDYTYDELSLAQRRESTRARVQELEAQRLQVVLNKLANGNNPNVDVRKGYDEPIRLIENGIAAVRGLLAELDAQLKEQGQEPPPHANQGPPVGGPGAVVLPPGTPV